MKGPSILIIDDEPLMRLSISDALKAVGYEVRAVATGNEGMALLTKESFDMMITDLRLPGADGLSLLQVCKQRSPRTEVIVITAHASVDSAIEALKLGAYDYITKPFSMDELILIVERVSKVLALRQEPVESPQQLEGRFSFQGVLGTNEKMREIIEQVKALARSDGPVLIVGEPGTGKELLANTIHRNSGRRDHGLIKVTCAGQTVETLEIELFGHEKGAVPGGTRQRRGRLELTNKGTLYLDEIADLPEATQRKLYHCIRERRYQRIGGRDFVETDVRVICGTKMELRPLVDEGRFRRELYELLAPSMLRLPALRERRDDILAIALHFLRVWGERQGKTFKGFSPDAEAMLVGYSYPGNVRELEHLVQQAAALGRGHEEIHPWDLCGLDACPFLGGATQPNCVFCQEGLSGRKEGPRRLPLTAAQEQFEREYISDTLRRVRGDCTEASKLLGITRDELRRKCRRYGIEADLAAEP